MVQLCRCVRRVYSDTATTSLLRLPRLVRLVRLAISLPDSSSKWDPGRILTSISGSAAYVFGDSSLDQGSYAVYLNASGAPLSTFTPAATLSGRSQGCDRNATSTCLKRGALKYYTALPWGTHTLKVVKLGNSSEGDVGAYCSPVSRRPPRSPRSPRSPIPHPAVVPS